VARKLIVSDFVQDVLPAISDEEAGWLFRALVALNSGQDPPGKMPPSLSVAWLGIRKKQQELVDAYERTCEARRQAGRAGGIAKSSKRKQMLANASKGWQSLANCGKEKEKEKADEPLPSKRVKKPMSDDPMSRAPASAPASVEPDTPPVPSAIGPSEHRSSVFINPSSFGDPVDYALAVTEEPVTIYARRCYGAYLRDLGKGDFVDAVERFAAEVRAGEVPHSLPAALNARLKAALSIRRSIESASSGS